MPWLFIFPSHEYLRGEGTYEVTIESIRLLAGEWVNVAVRTTVTRKNVAGLEEEADLAVNLGASKLGFVRFFPAGRGMSYKEELMLGAEDILLFQESLERVREKYSHELEILADPCVFLTEEVYKSVCIRAISYAPAARYGVLLRQMVW